MALKYHYFDQVKVDFGEGKKGNYPTFEACDDNLEAQI